MTTSLASSLRVFRPSANVIAFYDGRIDGRRAYSTNPNWLDDGAYKLGICSYAIVDGRHALVYDTHISLAHARTIRDHLESEGIREMRVVLSHWHDDHVAGNEIFADCEIIAHRLTAEILAERRAAMESADPPIRPLVLPNQIWESEMTIDIGRIRVDLTHADIHSRDATVLMIPSQNLLMAGDTLEDPITYVDEPERLEIHREHLRAMQQWPISRIFPNHGSPTVIESGGYPRSLIDGTLRYLEKLLQCRNHAALAGQDLRTFAAEDFENGILHYYPPYEGVHHDNVRAVCSIA